VTRSNSPSRRVGTIGRLRGTVLRGCPFHADRELFPSLSQTAPARLGGMERAVEKFRFGSRPDEVSIGFRAAARHSRFLASPREVEFRRDSSVFGPGSTSKVRSPGKEYHHRREPAALFCPPTPPPSSTQTHLRRNRIRNLYRSSFTCNIRSSREAAPPTHGAHAIYEPRRSSFSRTPRGM